MIASPRGKNLQRVTIDPVSGQWFGTATGTRLFRAPCPEHADACNDPSACSQQKCPHCETPWTKSEEDFDSDDRDQKINSLKGAEHLVLGIAAETVLYGMPVYPDVSREWKPAKGRRLLCFSDSRREAARLGPLLSAQHETWVIRSAMARVLAGHVAPSADYLKEQLERFEHFSNDSTRSKGDRDRARRDADGVQKELALLNNGIPFSEFAKTLEGEAYIAEILDCEAGEKHAEWRQERWRENQQSVQRHAEALIGQELDNPLRTAVSLEAVGILELVYPALDSLPLPAQLAKDLPVQVCDQLKAEWSSLLAALFDTTRADRAVDWSIESSERQWNGESPLYGRWTTRDKSGWKSRRFIGDAEHDPLQLRLWFVQKLLQTIGGDPSLADAVLRAAFNQLYELAVSNKLSWLRAGDNEVGRGIHDKAIQILLDRLYFRRPSPLYYCPVTSTFWPRSVFGWAPLRGCLGGLQQISQQEADRNRRWGRHDEKFENPLFSRSASGAKSIQHS